MIKAPAGIKGPRPLWDDEIGQTMAASSEAGADVGLRVLRVAIVGRAERRRLRGTCLAVSALTPHPGVLTLHEVGFTDDDHPFLLTDLPRASLAGRLAEAGPLAVGIAARIGQELATTLAAAHDSGILHLDVRPGNVVWGDGPAPLLTDFGVTQAALAAGAADLTPPSLVHAAREIFGWETPGPPADVYGLASTVYTMLAGQAPYHAEALAGRAALYQRVLRGAPPPVPARDVPARLSTLLADMMAPDPASRPPLAEVAATLAEAAESPGRPARRATGSSPAGTPASPIAAALGSAAAGEPGTQGSATRPEAAGLASAAPDSVTPPSRGDRGRPRYGALLLLLGVGVVALLAGIVWGVVSSPAPAPSPTPAAGPTAVGTLPAAQQGAYRPQQVTVQPVSGGERVSWAAPSVLAGVSEYIVIAERGGEPSQEHTVKVSSTSVTFTGLEAGQRYCFIVGSLLEPASGQPATDAAPPVCATL